MKQGLVAMNWRSDPLPIPNEGTVLPVGLMRSYGDSCLDEGGTLLSARPLDRLIDFDPETGRLTCEAGVAFDALLAFSVPRGWFLPVTPGTQFVTVGGAIANDVHGKNHHQAGTFGRFVRKLELLRSDGTRRICSSEENAEWFSATVGGLGLTGFITWAEIQLQPIHNAYIESESVRFRGLEGFFEIDQASKEWPYTVAWIDCLARGKSLGRGLYMRGRHAGPGHTGGLRSAKKRLSVPVDMPELLLNPWTLKAFNAAYYRKQWGDLHRAVVHYRPFFYPLDAVGQWNRIYGKRGFLQWQCVVPREGNGIARILEGIAAARTGSFLAVLKTFGSLKSPGRLSFPREGVTLALDFPNRPETFRLLDRLDGVVREQGGALYPVKDARMSPAMFRASFPEWEAQGPYLDPRFSSSFWRRVTKESGARAASVGASTEVAVRTTG